MAADLRLQPRRKPFLETGSPFDATEMSRITVRTDFCDHVTKVICSQDLVVTIHPPNRRT